MVAEKEGVEEHRVKLFYDDEIFTEEDMDLELRQFSLRMGENEMYFKITDHMAIIGFQKAQGNWSTELCSILECETIENLMES